MNTLFKIAGICIILTGLSIPSCAASTFSQSAAGKEIKFTGTAGDLTFTPSGNTVMNGTSADTAYTITAGCSKTTTANGIEYAMVHNYSGYYQRTQAADTAAPPATITVSGWTAMGGGS